MSKSLCNVSSLAILLFNWIFYSFFLKHDNREEEKDLTWGENRGRGRGTFLRGRARFIIRKATGGPNIASRKWAHDKFQVDGDQEAEKGPGQDHREGGTVGEHTWQIVWTLVCLGFYLPWLLCVLKGFDVAVLSDSRIQTASSYSFVSMSLHVTHFPCFYIHSQQYLEKKHCFWMNCCQEEWIHMIFYIHFRV